MTIAIAAIAASPYGCAEKFKIIVDTPAIPCLARLGKPNFKIKI